jgi:uncharacterized membrane protein
MKNLGNHILKGLATVLPIALTIYCVYWLVTSTEKLLGRGITALVPEIYSPGLGLAAGLLLLILIGALMNFLLVRRLVRWGEHLLESIPLVKTIYGAVSDMLGFFSSKSDGEANQVVTVDMGNGRKMLGFVTRSDCSSLPDELARDGDVAVFFPMSYQMGGFTVFMPRDKIVPINMKMQDAMRLALTAGVGNKDKKHD